MFQNVVEHSIAVWRERGQATKVSSAMEVRVSICSRTLPCRCAYSGSLGQLSVGLRSLPMEARQSVGARAAVCGAPGFRGAGVLCGRRDG